MLFGLHMKLNYLVCILAMRKIMQVFVETLWHPIAYSFDDLSSESQSC